MNSNCIYDYLDCHEYLKDWFAHNKTKPEFSLRAFAQRVGLTGGDVVGRIITGERKLIANKVYKFVKGLSLSSREAQYFELMVNYSNADSNDEKEYYFNRLQEIIPSHDTRVLRKKEFEYLSKWYHQAIRSLLCILPINDAVQIANLLEYNVRIEEVQESLDLQTELGLLKRDPQGNYQPVDMNLESGPLFKEPAFINLHKDLSKLANIAMEFHPIKSRKIYGVNFSISEKGWEQIQLISQKYTEDIRAVADNDKDENRVVQVNLQLFPLTKKFR